ncbi:hypothetical protein EI983_13335 [Roseovarius faecimaris]|uniref:Uncharacterized protein n=1 Tax=Roseovarius faecimaris TaxID=2494550 RepID=A0A6I6IUX5_9RHOB|nr:hypothetical protein [Roseovarius faecimaris]QGX99196.1 hypothetical protein EI983_13335 [Roseovarius faecimaris]
MSDPVTNVEIEDVLSSIRRLVSADDRAQKDAPQEAADDGDAPASEDKTPPADALVLTPALRVSATKSASAEEAGQADEAAAAQPENHAEAEPEADTWQDDTPEQAEDGSDALEGTAEPDDGSPQPDEWSDDEDTGAAPEPEPEEETAADAPQDHDDHWQDDERRENAVDALSERAAGFEEAVAAREDDWEPDGDAPGDDNAAEPTQPFTWQDEIEDAEIVSPNEGLEPYVAEEDDFAPEALAPDPGPEPAKDNAFAGAEDPLGDDEAVLDEEALRDLVTEIVRQELQGSLGERITRNVRKLVRREIHRALATKELE